LKKNHSQSKKTIPLRLLAKHITSTLMTVIQYWQEEDMRTSPEIMTRYFEELIKPLVE
jgi:hypothetical protein